METKPSKKNYTSVDTSPSLELTVKVKINEKEVHEILITPDASIQSVKGQIFSLTQIEENRQRLIHFGKMLQNDKTVEDYKINSGDYIHLAPLPKNFDPENVHNSGAGIEPVENLSYIPQEGDIATTDYFERVELGFCRARMRLLSSTMLFYYLLTVMSAVTNWMHPSDLDGRYIQGHEPSELYLFLNIVESVLGINAAMAGMRAAASDLIPHARKFILTTMEVSLVHFIAFIVFSRELLSGDIQYKLTQQGGTGPTDEDVQALDPLQVTILGLFISLAVWFSILSVAFKYYKQLAIVHPGQEEETDWSMMFTRTPTSAATQNEGTSTPVEDRV